MYGKDANHYREQAIATATPAQLVLMLYDGVLTAISRASLAQESAAPDLQTVHGELTRAQDIVLELRMTLDREQGGEVASRLDSLYDFCFDRLVRANVSKDLSLTAPVAEVFREIREAWAEACLTAPVPQAV